MLCLLINTAIGCVQYPGLNMLSFILSYFRELKRNKIRVVDSLIFKELKALKSLKMQRNGITKLMDGALFGLADMEEL